MQVKKYTLSKGLSIERSPLRFADKRRKGANKISDSFPR
jgi:hypothetical protein